MKTLAETGRSAVRPFSSKRLDRRSILLLSLAAGAAWHVPRVFDSDGPAQAPVERDEPEGSVEPEIARRIKAISNVFEVGTPEADYSYIEDLGDGRGYTATQYGLVSNELELGRVIALHAAEAPETRLARYLPFLPPHDTGTDTEKLAGLADIWPREARELPSLARACDAIADELYFLPAMRAAASAGIGSAVGQAIFYDTILQHGGGNDPDSFWSILARAQAAGRDPATVSAETRFLGRFLEIRRSVLMNPANAETTDVWRASVTRVDALANLLERNPALSLPILVESTDIRIALT
jgi:chitosanase